MGSRFDGHASLKYEDCADHVIDMTYKYNYVRIWSYEHNNGQLSLEAVHHAFHILECTHTTSPDPLQLACTCTALWYFTGYEQRLAC